MTQSMNMNLHGYPGIHKDYYPLNKITFELLCRYITWLIVFMVQIYIFMHLFINISGQVSTFKPTSEEIKTCATIKLYRQKLTVKKRVDDDVWSGSFPIMYAEPPNDGIPFYGVRGDAKYIGPYLRKHKYSKNGYNGKMDLLFHRFDNEKSWVAQGNQGDKLYTAVMGIANFVELGRESYACATFEVHTSHAIYNIKMTDDCMYIKSLLQRWGSASRKYADGNLPDKITEVAKKANEFYLGFHREQPCYFFATFSKDHETIHSLPLKKVTYEPSLSGRGTTNAKYLNVMGESFDGLVFQMTLRSASCIEQSVKHYEKTDRIYPLKTNIVNENAHMNLDEFKNSKIDIHKMLVEAHFKYDVFSQLCYIKTMDDVLLLTKQNVEFLVDGNAIKIVYNSSGGTMFRGFVNENYGKLIENDARKCGIHNAKQN